MKGLARKELYRRLRGSPFKQLWDEVVRFDRASAQERAENVALVRAIGGVVVESGSPEQKHEARQWLRGLLDDPNEQVRRYAIEALPKTGGGAAEESQLLALLQRTNIEREKRFITGALEKIGGTATLQTLRNEAAAPLLAAEQKLKASLARSQTPSTVRLDAMLGGPSTRGRSPAGPDRSGAVRSGRGGRKGAKQIQSCGLAARAGRD